MAAYAVATTGLAALIQPIFDGLLPTSEQQGPTGIAAVVEPVLSDLLPEGNDVALIWVLLIGL